jgi:hypothetical protein
VTPAEAGHLALDRFTEADLTEAERSTFRWPKCLVCGQRPTMLIRPQRWLIFITGLPGEKIVNVPRYDILPCCSARYLKENTGPNRKQKIQLAAQVRKRPHVVL